MQELNNILWTKLKKPQITQNHVFRENLVNSIKENSYKPLTLISAPAGYGKSMLMSSALDIINRPYVWISLDEEDNDFRSFLEYLSVSIEKIFQNILDEFWNSVLSTELPPLSSVTNILINCLDNVDEEFFIVLDDFHLINDMEINKFMDTLIKYPPQNMHLVIISRRDPPLRINQLKAKNRLNEIRINDLCFTPEEAKELWINITDIELSESMMNRLFEKTEGWVVGLYLASISIKNNHSVDKLMEVLDSGKIIGSDFLVEEVIEQQPSEIQYFLEHTSILPRISEGLAETICYSDNKNIITGQEYYEWVTITNLFIIFLDDDQTWFRYHHLFQDILKRRVIKKYGKEYVKNLHGLAAEWFADHGFIDEAIRESIKYGDNDLSVSIILNNHAALTYRDRWFQVDRWISALPSEVVEKNNKLLLLKSWIYFYQINFIGMMECLQLLENNVEENIDIHIEGEIDYFRGYISFFSAKGVDAEKYLKSAVEKIPQSNSHALGEAELHYCLAKQMNGKYAEGIEFAKKKLETVSSSDLFRLTRLHASIFFIGMLGSDFRLASYHSGIVENIGKEFSSFYAESWGVYIQAIISFNRGKFEKAALLFEKTISNQFLGHNWLEIDSYASLLLIYHLTGQSEKLNEIHEKFESYIKALGPKVNNIVNVSIEARLGLLKGDSKHAIEMLHDGRLEAPVGLMLWWSEIPNITECRVLIVEGSPENLDKAIEKLTELKSMHEGINHIFHSVTINVLLSIAFYKLKNETESIEMIKKAVDNARSSKWALPFIENSKDISNILKLLDNTSDTYEYLDQIFNTFESDQFHKVEPISISISNGISQQISSREMEVLSLLADGLRNKEIAEQLFLSTQTIKKHVYNIFQKLNVKSRLQAINVSKQKGIL